MKTLSQPLWKIILIWVAASGALAVFLAAFSAPAFWQAWLAAFVLALVFLGLLAWAWAAGGSRRSLAWLVVVCLLLRLAAGTGLFAALPEIGFDTDPQNAGYVYADAHRRDVQAFDLASSGQSLLKSFSPEFITDQYGGLLFLSAAVYRGLSPDAHRPLLMLLFSVFAASMGLIFLWRALDLRWGRRAAFLAGLLYTLYPENVLLGSSQMREPYLMALAAIGLWAVFSWKINWRKALVALALSQIFLAGFSSLALVGVSGGLAVTFWLENLVQSGDRRWKMIGWAAIGLAAVALIAFGRNWFQTFIAYEAYLTEAASGWVQNILDTLGRQWRLPFVTAYGIVRPLLPAAVSDPSLPVWQTIEILRALGWTLMLPVFLFIPLRVWKVQPGEDRRLILWSWLLLAAWIVISSARAGGDDWDNPRYRMILAPWLFMLAAWAWSWAREKRDPYLLRSSLVVLLFVLVFLSWYLARYYHIGVILSFPKLGAIFAAGTALIFSAGWIWDWIRRRK